MSTRIACSFSLIVALTAFGIEAQDVGHAAPRKQAAFATYTYLPSLGSLATAWGINAAGTVIVGSAWDRSDLLHSVKWTLQSDGSWAISDLPWPADATSAIARDANDSGDVAGNDFPASRSRPVIWFASGTREVLGCGSDVGRNATVYGISAQAQVVVGVSRLTPLDPTVPSEEPAFAAVWRPGGACREDLPPLVVDASAAAHAVNGNGTIVGGTASLSKMGPAVPVRWTKVADQWVVEQLDVRNGAVLGGNAAGDLAGYVYTVPCASQDECPRAAIWHVAGGSTVLGTLGGEQSAGYDINSTAEVVGISTTRRGPNTAYFWSESTGMLKLPFKGHWAGAHAVSDVRLDGTTLVVGDSSVGKAIAWVVRNP